MIPFLICIGILIVAFLIVLLVTHRLIQKRFGHRSAYPTHPVEDDFYDAYSDRYPRVPHSFYSGKNRLQGYLYGEKNNGALLVFAHGIGTGHESYMQEILFMVDHGWRVFAYDATGSCESEGKGTVGLVQSALDLHAALSYIERTETLKDLPICLMGHSWGGYAVAAVLGFDHPVRASVSISGYSEPVEMMMLFASVSIGQATKLLYPFAWIDTWLTFGSNAFLTAVRSINKSGIPVMIVQGSEDEMILPTCASIFSHAKEITNPNVVYRLVEADGQNGHSTLFYHAESLACIDAMKRARNALNAQYGGEVPEDVLHTFYQTIDRSTINRANEPLLEEMHLFLRKAIDAE